MLWESNGKIVNCFCSLFVIRFEVWTLFGYVSTDGMGTAEWRAAKSPAYYKRVDYAPSLKVTINPCVCFTFQFIILTTYGYANLIWEWLFQWCAKNGVCYYLWLGVSNFLEHYCISQYFLIWYSYFGLTWLYLPMKLHHIICDSPQITGIYILNLLSLTWTARKGNYRWKHLSFWLLLFLSEIIFDYFL